jgi:hypothetical protein
VTEQLLRSLHSRDVASDKLLSTLASFRDEIRSFEYGDMLLYRREAHWIRSSQCGD